MVFFFEGGGGAASEGSHFSNGYLYWMYCLCVCVWGGGGYGFHASKTVTLIRCTVWLPYNKK